MRMSGESNGLQTTLRTRSISLPPFSDTGGEVTVSWGKLRCLSTEWVEGSSLQNRESEKRGGREESQVRKTAQHLGPVQTLGMEPTWAVN